MFSVQFSERLTLIKKTCNNIFLLHFCETLFSFYRPPFCCYTVLICEALGIKKSNLSTSLVGDLNVFLGDGLQIVELDSFEHLMPVMAHDQFEGRLVLFQRHFQLTILLL